FMPDIGGAGTTVMFLGLALALVGLGVSFRALRRGIGGRRSRYGLNTVLMVGAFAGVLILVNFLAVRNNARLDLTATRQFSLAPATTQLLADLPEPIRATGFFQENNPNHRVVRDRIDDLLHEFERRSNGRL